MRRFLGGLLFTVMAVGGILAWTLRQPRLVQHRLLGLLPVADGRAWIFREGEKSPCRATLFDLTQGEMGTLDLPGPPCGSENEYGSRVLENSVGAKAAVVRLRLSRTQTCLAALGKLSPQLVWTSAAVESPGQTRTIIHGPVALEVRHLKEDVSELVCYEMSDGRQRWRQTVRATGRPRLACTDEVEVASSDGLDASVVRLRDGKVSATLPCRKVGPIINNRLFYSPAEHKLAYYDLKDASAGQVDCASALLQWGNWDHMPLTVLRDEAGAISLNTYSPDLHKSVWSVPVGTYQEARLHHKLEAVLPTRAWLSLTGKDGPGLAWARPADGKMGHWVPFEWGPWRLLPTRSGTVVVHDGRGFTEVARLEDDNAKVWRAVRISPPCPDFSYREGYLWLHDDWRFSVVDMSRLVVVHGLPGQDVTEDMRRQPFHS